MELLIPGLALVALMVWASTRIKRTAADAFAPETVETAQFTIKKPAGWLSIAVPTLAFEAYTKDYAPPPNEEMRLGTATVEVSNEDLDAAAEAAIAGAKIVDELREKVGDVHYRILTLNRSNDDLELLELVKLAEQNGKVYTFRIKSLAEPAADFRRDMEGMLDSFELK
jgi:hypothetical protein